MMKIEDRKPRTRNRIIHSYNESPETRLIKVQHIDGGGNHHYHPDHHYHHSHNYHGHYRYNYYLKFVMFFIQLLLITSSIATTTTSKTSTTTTTLSPIDTFVLHHHGDGKIVIF